MKKQIYDIKEMSDSKEIYGTRPNPFIAAFIYCLAGLLLAAVLYAVIGTIDMTVSAAGIVRPNDEISTVSSLLSGRVEKMEMRDGQHVKKGDLLFRLDTEESESSLESLKESREKCEGQIDSYETFAGGVEEEVNPFSSNRDSEEYPYYVEFENYLLTLETSRETAEYEKKSTEENIRKLKVQIEKMEEEEAGLCAYLESIEEKENRCQDYPAYERQYDMYMLTMESLEKTGSDETLIEQKEYEAVSQTEASLAAVREELETARSNLTLYELSLDAGAEGDGQAVTTETLAGVMNQIKTLKAQKEELDAQIRQLETQMEQAEVTAAIDGVVNMVYPVVKGDVVNAGTAMATIIPEDASTLKVQLYVSNADIGNVKTGDEVKYNLAAFPSSQYGICKGEIVSISKDVITDESGFSGYYLVEATIAETKMEDKDGNEGELTSGMELEAKIVTQKKQILRYLLEKIDLF